MNQANKSVAEAVIRRLFEGAQIDGIRFGPILQVLVTDHGSDKPHIAGQRYLSLGSSWAVFDRIPSPLPRSEAELQERSVDREIAEICELREQSITSARLGDEAPHLILTLESGKVVFVNGYLEQYEPWELGVCLGDPSELWHVVAGPGGSITVWAPPSFLSSTSAA